MELNRSCSAPCSLPLLRRCSVHRHTLPKPTPTLAFPSTLVSAMSWSCTKIITRVIIRVPGAVFCSWQHHSGCPALPEQLLQEGEQPQTINYSAAPVHTHTGAVETLCMYTHTVAGSMVTWAVQPLLSPLVPARPSEPRCVLEMSFELLQHVVVLRKCRVKSC